MAELIDGHTQVSHTSPEAIEVAAPRYLRYKAKDRQSERDDHLDQANRILHERVLRMRRDKLCTGCAKFDWSRAQYYARNFRTEGHPTADDPFRRITSVKDHIIWEELETVIEDSAALKLLADYPKFTWKLQGNDLQCTLCDTLAIALAQCRLDIPASEPDKYDDGTIVLTIASSHQPLDGHKCQKETVQTTFGAEIYRKGFESEQFFIYPLVDERRPHSADMPLPCVAHRALQDCVNTSLLAEWLETCDNEHAHDLSTKSLNARSLPGLFYIDVRQKCIVSGNPLFRYAALSYTWGPREPYLLLQNNLAEMLECNSLIKVASQLGQVVHDAIKVCEDLKIPYLWIDSLCIVQDNMEDKSAQIQNMDRIYSKSYVTLVVAGQKVMTSPEMQALSSENGGIPRVSKPNVGPSPTFTMDGITYAINSSSPDNVQATILANTVWSTRGWTFQEFVLSRRILAFTHDEAFLYCRNGLLTERSFVLAKPTQSMAWEAISYLSHCGSVHISGRQPNSRLRGSGDSGTVDLDSYLDMVAYYMTRVLKFEHDFLNAFSGVINAHTLLLGHFHWGLPVRHFARSLLLSMMKREDMELPTRRQQFPSWSWLGWKYLGTMWSPSISLSTRSQTTQPVVHIYTLDGTSYTNLLLGPWEDGAGVQGYCTESIERYNKLLLLDPLPVSPSLANTPRSPQIPCPASHLLIFWTHIAQVSFHPAFDDVFMQCEVELEAAGSDKLSVPLDFSDLNLSALLDPCNPSASAEIEASSSFDGWESKLDFALIAIQWPKPGVEHEEEYYGIYIKRSEGLAHRIGAPMLPLTRRKWLAGNPQKELIFLV